MFAQVSLAGPFGQPFDYHLPEGLVPELGARVLVPFGPGERIGFVIGLMETSEQKGVRDLLLIIDQPPLFGPKQLGFLLWAAEYYGATPADLFESALPGGLKPKIKRQINIGGLPPDLESTQAQWLEGIQDLDPFGLQKKQSFLKNQDLYRRALEAGWIQIARELTPLEEAGVVWISLGQAPVQMPRTGSKKARLLELLQAAPQTQEGLLLQVEKAEATLRTLIKEGVLISKTLVPNPPQEVHHDQFLTLNPEQSGALVVLEEARLNGRFQAFLLKGVTGSGKTEVYLHLARSVIEAGRQVLVLLPEISLTPQAIARFEARFGQRLAVLHSQMSEGRRAQEWLKIKKGRVDLVIGARSAIFAPLENIGLILVDEEHDGSYKQQETPFYHARDLSLKLGVEHQALVLLGSATPSVESYHNAQTGKYKLLELHQRVDGSLPPKLQILGLKDLPRVKGVFYLTSLLYQKLQDNLAAGRQAILFLNRRGYAACLSCKACETPVLCSHCSIAMTWHQTKNQLICHHCGEQEFYPRKCKTCGETKFSLEGIGTQRVERDLKVLFPEARFLRMDKDSLGRRGSLEEAMGKIDRQEVDFIIGTQLIAKGHDFMHVGLVAILFADMSLNIPDFRSSERSYQLFAQVSGRAGRGEGDFGEAYLQTYNPTHHAIETAVNQDYTQFFALEERLRQELKFPPFSRFIQIRLSDPKEERAQEAAQALGDILRDYQRQLGFELIGPKQSEILKIADRYYWTLLFRTERPGSLKALLARVLLDKKAYHLKGSTRLSLDVDPYLLL